MKKIVGILLLSMIIGCPAYAATPTRQTDVTTPDSGNMLFTIRGKFYTEKKDAVLKRINEIRYEACKEGLINPVGGKPLTLSDYKPIRWSSDLEWIAQTRAAEAAVGTSGHTRPNGKKWYNCKHNDIHSSAEDLSWNFSGLMAGIQHWYTEKEDWVKQTPGAVTGHYTSLISPDYNYVGIGCFMPEADDGWGTYTVAGEFSWRDNLDESQIGVSGLYDQIIEIQEKDLETYKKYAPHEHTMEYIPAKNATDTKNGNIAYYRCKGCGKCFLDEAGEQQISESKTIIPKLKGKAQSMTVKAGKKTVSAKKLKKKAVKVSPIKVKSAKGPVTYQITGGSKKAMKAMKINPNTGKITVKKSTKKGTYKLKVTVTAGGNAKYKPASKKVSVVIIIK